MLAALSGYLINILLGIDVLANAILGGRRYSTISSRIGESIKAGGWASKVPWPHWWVRHCLASDYTTEI